MPWHERNSFVDCPWCGLTNTRLITVAAQQEVKDKLGNAKYWATLGCPSCGNAVLMRHPSPKSADTVAYEMVPRSKMTDSQVKHLPEDVSRYYDDALRVLRVGVPDAAAVQLRRTLEAAAAHYDIKEKVLVKSIEKLIAEGHVTQSFAPVLHHIRAVGNVGAHASDERVDHETAERALRFTTQLLRNLFEVPGELQELSADEPNEPEQSA
ncbi:DUF4145 domain-containing protein [Streptomyces asoensis]|uniref:DUF4145 domain-containing protein n=1 Tax=Streptomyces asoensis TaxID=249586 RepID=A0ABQ3RYR3_9ACTN|nr:DUF4145 domain-containing protein [Streptomyces asoensis]GGQ48377.1 hypothetical protein GCM10010496_08170 [Streptomyces asoensis]GHI61009.1 hypothetical protein Saso_26590 [Streptomyces asoensis]